MMPSKYTTSNRDSVTYKRCAYVNAIVKTRIYNDNAKTKNIHGATEKKYLPLQDVFMKNLQGIITIRYMDFVRNCIVIIMQLAV